MSSIMEFFSVFCVVLLFSFSGYAADPDMDDTTKVICNIIGYVWGIGGPLMTVVIIGAALLAIFGRMPWPALFALGMFCGVFFGAKTIITKIMPNVSDEAKAMLENCGKRNP
ncbi:MULTISPECIES: TrbC/VirB2 family protein [Wolbachia]|uniref:TrbC/VirB2 family protein n=1 Tax=Wolbachia TaxID=953 RepID=UPI0008710F62|nr:MULTISPECIES: TrbC/VirB2 family protein [Wolbachia]MDE5063216.1 TrbC/VirB2 family protein [Wolbachia endosymbiont of Drosophila chauvacae]BEP31177.1 MAG: hypothetical protein WBIAU1_06550 [Wolbachia endosymbiont of Drosophila biauraria]AOV87468.1 membrane protein [Wolbachia endosymbiont of Drosophila incompta]MBA8752943.1 TrbC/VirB2 family protein [Wolbachia pipientis]MBA8753754.1 TrbC/VirB2 family protein [Wolbachia pipientis]